MPLPSTHPVHANVAFLRVPAFDSRPVAEQAAIKEKLESRTRKAIEALAPGDRVVLDAEAGLAIVVFGDSAKALAIAQQIQRAEPDEPLQAGLNYGPLALSAHGAESRVFGDGLTGAAAAARFADPGKLLVSQDFANMLRHRHPERAAELATAGDFTDTRVRMHSFLTPDLQRGIARRRRLLAYGVLGVISILSLGIAGRQARYVLFPPLPAVVKFVVKPRGEVFVDGMSRGFAPPLAEIEVAAGPHNISIRNAGSPSLDMALDFLPGEKRTIQHTFTRPQVPRKPPPPAPKEGFWDSLKRKFGNP